jgi:hypothetical protein
MPATSAAASARSWSACPRRTGKASVADRSQNVGSGRLFPDAALPWSNRSSASSASLSASDGVVPSPTQSASSRTLAR